MPIDMSPTGSSADVGVAKHYVLFFHPDRLSPWLQNERHMVKEEEPSRDPPKTRDCTLMSKGRTPLFLVICTRGAPLISVPSPDFCSVGGEVCP